MAATTVKTGRPVAGVVQSCVLPAVGVVAACVIRSLLSHRGLTKNTAQLHTLFDLSNLWMVRRTLQLRVFVKTFPKYTILNVISYSVRNHKQCRIVNSVHRIKNRNEMEPKAVFLCMHRKRGVCTARTLAIGSDASTGVPFCSQWLATKEKAMIPVHGIRLERPIRYLSKIRVTMAAAIISNTVSNSGPKSSSVMGLGLSNWCAVPTGTASPVAISHWPANHANNIGSVTNVPMPQASRFVADSVFMVVTCTSTSKGL